MTIVEDNANMVLERLVLGPYDTNCYILSCKKTGEAILVDAPAEAKKILAALKGKNPKYIVITHNHMDHLGALEEVRSALSIPVAAHPLDAEGLPSTPEIFLKQGDRITFGNLSLDLFHTPGHTPGSICLYMAPVLLSGDTIFPGGPGKTGSPERLSQIVASIKDKIFVLPEDTRIYPGHGESTTLKKEKAEFEVFASRPHDPGLCGDVLWLSS
ncbi:MAG: MBL fold metallo-hydrolase [Deltaproteobacteria bacterium]|nr:MBL fold metallo-hydrolase [Deltaproteobacteria bacterium]